MSSPFPGPTPAYNNPPINPEYYQPSRFEISSITFGRTTLVTTSEEYNYVIGQVVRIEIPFLYGAQEISGKQGYVISLPSTTQFEVEIDSTNASAFNPSPSTPTGYSVPQVVAIGDVNSGQVNMGRSNNLTYIPGSFINISPN